MLIFPIYFLKLFVHHELITQSQILTLCTFGGWFSMCSCEKLTATSSHLSQLFFTLEKSRRLDFNKAFDLVTYTFLYLTFLRH